MKIVGEFSKQNLPALVALRPDLTDIKCIVAGHSHTIAVASAILLDSSARRTAEELGIGVYLGHADADYWASVINAADSRFVALIWAGNDHNADFLFKHDGAFDFISSRWPEARIEAGSVLVPEELLRQYFLPVYAEMVSKGAAILSAGAADLMIIGTPPPRLSTEEFRTKILNEAFFVEKARSLGVSLETVPIASLSFRTKLWHLIQDLMEDGARDLGASFIPVPSDAVAPDGSLLPQYWATDATHANEHYGRLIVKAVANHMGAQGT